MSNKLKPLKLRGRAMDQPYVTVIPGVILIESGRYVRAHEDVFVYELNLKSKYPGPVVTASTGDTLIVYLSANEETLYTNLAFPLSAPTEVLFEFEGAHEWAIIADAARYTARICIYKPGEV